MRRRRKWNLDALEAAGLREEAMSRTWLVILLSARRS
jgi:hypothetical protein